MRNKKVAIIDNDKKSLRNLEEILIGSGYTPIPVSNAFLAVDTVIENRPDVILMELKMPRKNGFELTGAVNRIFKTRRIPIIAMSESFKDDFRFLLDLCGINRYLKKPFCPLDVIWAIESVTEEGDQLDTRGVSFEESYHGKSIQESPRKAGEEAMV